MVNLKNKIANKNKVSAILAVLIVSLIILGCGGKPEMPPESTTQSLLKTSMTDLADAIDKNDFKAFRDKASADFQASLSEDKLKSTFKTFVDKKEIFVPILKQAGTKDGKFDPAPSMREEKGNYILVAKGKTEVEDDLAKQVNFDNEWVWRDGAWKLLKIVVKVE